MKIILVLAALACVASAAPSSELSKQIIEGLAARLLPAFEHELLLNKTEIVLENSLASGVVSLDGGKVINLDTLTDTLKLNILALTLKGEVTVPLVQLTGQYTADVLLALSTGEQKVVGAGPLDASATDALLTIDAKLGLNIITQIVSVKTLNFVASIKTALIIAEGALANGEPIDNEAVSKDLPGRIDEYFANHGAEFNVEVLEVVNKVLATHTLAEWLEILGQSRIQQ
jgi:hypothetical protein